MSLLNNVQRRGLRGSTLLGLWLCLGSSPALSDPGTRPNAEEHWVVEAYYEDEAQVRKIAARAQHIGFYPHKGFVRLQADGELLSWLRELGIRVEIDSLRTSWLTGAERTAPKRGAGIPGFPCYRTVEETFASATAIAAAHPTLASWIDIGDSWEKANFPGSGYDLRVLRLTQSASPGPKPALFVNTAIHAREYTTAELGTRFAEHLVSGYGIDPDITWLLDHHQIHLLLVNNPDGRKRAEGGLSWRKNANNNYCSDSNSRGADLNRNFEFQWGCCGGSSSSPCSSIYRGVSPASEPEVAALQSYLRGLFPDQRPDDLTTPAPDEATGVMLDVHSFGEDVLWSWGFSTTPPPNNPQLTTLGRKYAFFTGYRAQYGSLSTVEGATKDFAYGALGVPGYTIELGTTFFESCNAFESAIVSDNIEALLYAAKVSRTPYMTPAGPEILEPRVPARAVAIGESVTLHATADDTRFSQINGVEPTQTIASAEIYVGTPPWDGGTPLAMSAVDGAFDEKIEALEATLDTSSLAAGQHLLFVRALDETGRQGPVSAAFLQVIDPATSPIIEGTITDASTGAPLAATIIARGIETTADAGTGFFQLQMPSGVYQVEARADGYRPEAVELMVSASQSVVQDFALTSFRVAFSDDVEGGNLGWTTSGAWAITDEASNSPDHSWTDSPGGNYGANVNASLTSPPLVLTNLVGVELTFSHIYDLERSFDFAFVEFSTTGGSTWSQAGVWSRPDQSADWRQEVVPLPMLDGVSDARIRFRLDSDGSQQRDGWHLDDIVVRGVESAPPLFSDGFESADLSAWSASQGRRPRTGRP